MAILLAILGFLVGGLANQLGSDLPARRKLSRPYCPYCGQERPRWQWLALPVFLAGRATCTNLECKRRIRWRHPLVEIGLAVSFGYLWFALGPYDQPAQYVKLFFYLIYAAIFALILITDMERRLILHVVTFPAIAIAIIASFFLPDILPKAALTGGAVGFFTFLLLVIVGKIAFGSGAMGEGDITLATFVGLVTGFPLVIEALVLTTFIGAAISFVLLITRVRTLRDYIPYGPFLIIGAVITMLWGYPIADWYLRR